MQHISKLPNIGATIFPVMSALANKHKAINLSQGFPDFPCDPQLINLVTDAMNEGYNQYSPVAGNMELREVIANKIQSLYNTGYNPENEIAVTVGAVQAIFTIITTFVKPNDEVIIFKPAFDSYEPSVTLSGGKTIAIQLKSPNYNVDWDEVRQKVNSRTKMIIINSPHNPTGIVFSQDDMLQLQEITKGTNIVVLSDEVYEHMVFDGEKHYSACMFPDLKSRSFVVKSLGKTFHNTGWRIGYCCAPKALMDLFVQVHQFNVFSVHHPTQKAVANFMKNPKNYLELSEFFQRKRDLFLNLIKDSRFKFKPSKGTYFQILNYSDITNEHDVDYAKRLTIEHGIASIPLSIFNVDNVDNKELRFCFAKKDDTLKRAADILNSI